jgi:hypothetical protein
VEREFGLLRIGPGYFWHHHLKNLFNAVFRRPGCVPFDLACFEILGALAGPWFYFRERKRLVCEVHLKQQASAGARGATRDVRVRHGFSQHDAKILKLKWVWLLWDDG